MPCALRLPVVDVAVAVAAVAVAVAVAVVVVVVVAGVAVRALRSAAAGLLLCACFSRRSCCSGRMSRISSISIGRSRRRGRRIYVCWTHIYVWRTHMYGELLCVCAVNNSSNNVP